MTRKSLSDSFRPDPGDPTLALDTQRPLPAQSPPEDGLVQVYAVVGVRTSARAEIGLSGFRQRRQAGWWR